MSSDFEFPVTNRLVANELRSMRLAISRRIDRALNFSASWIGCNSAESIEVTQRDDGVYTVTKGLSLRFAWRRRFGSRRWNHKRGHWESQTGTLCFT